MHSECKLEIPEGLFDDQIELMHGKISPDNPTGSWSNVDRYSRGRVVQIAGHTENHDGYSVFQNREVRVNDDGKIFIIRKCGYRRHTNIEEAFSATTISNGGIEIFSVQIFKNGKPPLVRHSLVKIGQDGHFVEVQYDKSGELARSEGARTVSAEHDLRNMASGLSHVQKTNGKLGFTRELANGMLGRIGGERGFTEQVTSCAAGTSP